MYIVTICIIICLFLTYRESKGTMKNGMAWGMALVTFLGCIHYDYGNDYMSYYELYKEWSSYSFDSIIDGVFFKDPGWVVLNYIFSYLGGFFVLVAVLNIVQNYIVYRFIRREVDKDWWLFATFVYLVTSELYLYNFSMMRQSFALYVFLGLWPYIKERKWWIPLIALFFCSFVHASSRYLIPFAFLGFLPSNKPKLVGYTYLIAFLILWFSAEALNNLLMFTMEFEEVQKYFDRYGGLGNSKIEIGVGFVVQLIPFLVAVLGLLSEKINDNNHIRLVCLGIFGFMVTPFTTFLPLLGRFGIYFSVYSIGALPLAYKSIDQKNFRVILIWLYVFITVYNYFKFFTLQTWQESYSTFHTIFSQM